MRDLDDALEELDEARRARRPDIVDVLAEQLRDHEWAWSCSPVRPDRDGTEWARMRVEALLGTLRDELVGSAAIEEAEPHVEAVVEQVMRGDDSAELTPAAEVTRKTIEAACRGIQFPERLVLVDRPADVLLSAAVRCGWAEREVLVGHCWRPPSISVGEVTWFWTLVVNWSDPDAFVCHVTDEEIRRAGLEICEHAVRQMCQEMKLDFTPPTETQAAEYRAEEADRRAARAAG